MVDLRFNDLEPKCPAWADFCNHTKWRKEHRVVSLEYRLLRGDSNARGPLLALFPSLCIYFPRMGRR